MRNAFADEITRIASMDERLILLSGDIGNRLFEEYKNAFPNRFLNCGVAEANMTGVAAGLAMNGLRPITYTIAPFATTRCFEQIRDDICYHNLPVIIIGIGSGLGYAELGATHQSLEDIAILRALPNMTVLCPADPQETRLALRAALNMDGPVYLRLGKKGEKPVHEKNTNYQIGHAMPLRLGSDCALLSTGVIAPLALEVANSLADQNITTKVIHFPSVKPLDNKTLVHCVQKYQLIATIEEHSRIGGFGSAVAEWLSDYGAHTTTLLRYGTQDKFFCEAGGTLYARWRHGLSENIISDDIADHLKCIKLNVS
jgi:transketolase